MLIEFVKKKKQNKTMQLINKIAKERGIWQSNRKYSSPTSDLNSVYQTKVLPTIFFFDVLVLSRVYKLSACLTCWGNCAQFSLFRLCRRVTWVLVPNHVRGCSGKKFVAAVIN
jgi:hypothetical protein